MLGKIEQITKEASKSGDYLRVKIDGETYSIWDEQYFDNLVVGDTIEFEYKESGQWKNISELNIIDSETNALPDREEYNRLRDKRIAKMSCIKSAAYVMANLNMDSMEKGEQTLSLAKTFEKYIYEDDLKS